MLLSKEETQHSLNRIKAVREAGEVRRCHAMPHQSPYTIASHCYGAVSLLLLLHPNPSVSLIKALMWHDVAERWLGDLPSPGKAMSDQLGAIYDHLEVFILQKLDMFPELTGGEQLWLKAMDLADLFLWANTEQHQNSNWAAVEMLESCKKGLNALLLKVTPEKGDNELYALLAGLDLLMKHQARGDFHDRLSDYMWTPKN